jgi:predicted deacylase
VVLARQHSGETQGSFLIEGMMDYLLSSNLMLDVRKKFLIHFIPVVNPEGIAHGNYRTNIRGYDINRSWRNPKLEKTPESYYIKVYLRKIHQESPITLILDLHGHSKSFNSFFYGNPKNMQSYTTKENPKFLPYFLSTKIKEISYSQCCFGVTQGKSDTARVVLGEIFPKALVYTI